MFVYVRCRFAIDMSTFAKEKLLLINFLIEAFSSLKCDLGGFLYGPFSHASLKLDMLTLFATYVL